MLSVRCHILSIFVVQATSRKEKRIIIKDEYRYPIDKHLIELPGGTFDLGEKDPLAVAKRELLEETGYIFTTVNGKRLSGDTIYELHRKFLSNAGIPYIGNGNGPRIHDWRHTFAVRSFKQLVDSGVDLYVALPVLSTYLGHKTIYATEKYLRLTVSIYPYIEEKWKASIDDIFGKAVTYEED